MQLGKLNGRTGDESLLITVRSDPTHFNAPLVYRTGERVDEFCNLGLKASPEEIGTRMEGYMISGVSGAYLCIYKCFADFCMKVSSRTTLKFC